MANDFLPFATGGTPNVLSQAAWQALAARSTGFQAGIADSAALNKAWRQAAAMTAALGSIVDAEGFNALDNGNQADLITALRNTLGKLYGGGGTLAGNGWQRLPDGLIIQWGLFGGAVDVPGGAPVVVSGAFPVAFPTACHQLLGTLVDTSPSRAAAIMSATFDSTNGSFVVGEFTAGAVQSLGVRFLAIGR